MLIDLIINYHVKWISINMIGKLPQETVNPKSYRHHDKIRTRTVKLDRADPGP